jgi:hypothetical protein
MGLDLWFREDVARILASTKEGMRAVMGSASPLDPELAEAYRKGFSDALQTVGVAFGVSAPSDSDPGDSDRPAVIVYGRAWRRERIGVRETSRANCWPCEEDWT